MREHDNRIIPKIGERWVVAAFLGWLACGCQTPPDFTAVTPQRPTVSSDTNTTFAGTFELESGLAYDRNDRSSLPSTLKYGFDERVELSLSTSPWTRIERPGRDEIGPEDLLLAIRARVLDEEADAPGLALGASLKAPTANDRHGLGSGEWDGFANVAVSKTVDDLSFVGYYQLGVLGNPQGPDVDVQHVFALAGGWAFREGFSLFEEIALDRIHEQDQAAWLSTTGVAWSVDPRLTLDTAVRLGLSNDAPDVVFQVGLTWNLGGPSR